MNTDTKETSPKWGVYRINDCDWWLARSLAEAKESAVREYGDGEQVDEEARELTAEELERTQLRLEEWRCDCGATLNEAGAEFRFNGRAWEHHHEYPVGHVEMRNRISFREELENRIKAGPRVEVFASTEF